MTLREHGEFLAERVGVAEIRYCPVPRQKVPGAISISDPLLDPVKERAYWKRDLGYELPIDETLEYPAIIVPKFTRDPKRYLTMCHEIGHIVYGHRGDVIYWHEMVIDEAEAWNWALDHSVIHLTPSLERWMQSDLSFGSYIRYIGKPDKERSRRRRQVYNQFCERINAKHWRVV